jgi:hypothetical protein
MSLIISSFITFRLKRLSALSRLSPSFTCISANDLTSLRSPTFQPSSSRAFISTSHANDPNASDNSISRRRLVTRRAAGWPGAGGCQIRRVSRRGTVMGIAPRERRQRHWRRLIIIGIRRGIRVRQRERGPGKRIRRVLWVLRRTHFDFFCAAFFCRRGNFWLLFFDSLGVFWDFAGADMSPVAPARRATFPAAVPIAFAAVTKMLSSGVSMVSFFFGMFSFGLYPPDCP